MEDANALRLGFDTAALRILGIPLGLAEKPHGLAGNVKSLLALSITHYFQSARGLAQSRTLSRYAGAFRRRAGDCTPYRGNAIGVHCFQSFTSLTLLM